MTLQILRMVAEKMHPPRALYVPFAHGFPLDRPDEPERQTQVIEAALELLEDTTLEPPVLVDYHPDKEAVLA